MHEGAAWMWVQFPHNKPHQVHPCAWALASECQACLTCSSTHHPHNTPRCTMRWAFAISTWPRQSRRSQSMRRRCGCSPAMLRRGTTWAMLTRLTSSGGAGEGPLCAGDLWLFVAGVCACVCVWGAGGCLSGGQAVKEAVASHQDAPSCAPNNQPTSHTAVRTPQTPLPRRPWVLCSQESADRLPRVAQLCSQQYDRTAALRGDQGARGAAGRLSGHGAGVGVGWGGRG